MNKAKRYILDLIAPQMMVAGFLLFAALNPNVSQVVYAIMAKNRALTCVSTILNAYLVAASMESVIISNIVFKSVM